MAIMMVVDTRTGILITLSLIFIYMSAVKRIEEMLAKCPEVVQRRSSPILGGRQKQQLPRRG